MKKVGIWRIVCFIVAAVALIIGGIGTFTDGGKLFTVLVLLAALLTMVANPLWAIIHRGMRPPRADSPDSSETSGH